MTEIALIKKNRQNTSDRFPLKRRSKVRINLTFFLFSLLMLAGLLLLLKFINTSNKDIIIEQQTPTAIPPDTLNMEAVHGSDKELLTGAGSKEIVDSAKLGLPASRKTDQIVKHFAFTLSYSEEHEQAIWVAYRLKLEETTGTESRTDNFREDPAVRTGSSEPRDYLRSGYDRGHLVPAADMKWSAKAMSETFLMSNISPQDHSFNSGIWSKLEKKVRSWAQTNNEIYIVTGPVLTPGLKKIGHQNSVSVPEYFYKVILDAKQPELKAIGFIIPNQPLKESYWKYAVSVDSVEKHTGIDFFPALPDALEEKLESTFNSKSWK